MKAIRVGLVGSGFVSTIHADALKRVPGAELFAVVSPTGEHAAEFANRHGVRHHFRDYRRFLEVAELDHFVDCVANDKQPLETGEDGRAVLEIVLGAYASAGTGKKINLPFTTDADRPIALWKPVQ